jgi:HAD superfamily 5'-nucleotidase-like hydrolase
LANAAPAVDGRRALPAFCGWSKVLRPTTTDALMTQTHMITAVPPGRGIYCNRTLNLRSIKAIGYDMDYTLIHYRVDQWERRAYEHIKQRLSVAGWPVSELQFVHDLAVRGLIIDVELGNVLKANRFGYVKKAFHGTKELDFEMQRRVYSRVVVDLSEPRYVFLNTLFSISEACIYMQLVELLDARKLSEVLGYRELYARVRRTLDEAHMEGELKTEIVDDPDRFVDLDCDAALALLDQRQAGKKLMLITNSEWEYTKAMMAYAFDRFLPNGTGWRDLFHVIMVSARKPEFFSAKMPIFEVQEDSGLLRQHLGRLKPGGVYCGGYAQLVEQHLGVSGDDILYVGDHMFTDVHISKSVLRWRTALVVRELEDELVAANSYRHVQQSLDEQMACKAQLEYAYAQLKLQSQRLELGYGPKPTLGTAQLEAEMSSLRGQLEQLDAVIVPLVTQVGELVNARWGPLMRAGNDKSHLARQVERYADIYMSRVSNFMFHSPFLYLRSPRGSLPHDAG